MIDTSVEMKKCFNLSLATKGKNKKMYLDGVTRIGDAEDTVAETRHNAAAGEGVLGELSNLLDGGVAGTEFLLCVAQPAETLLVGEAVQWSGETVDARGVGKERIGEGGADEMGGVGGDVATFVVGVEHQVETSHFEEIGILGNACFVQQIIYVSVKK